MYLAALRVVTPKKDKQGINVFLHLHSGEQGGADVPTLSYEEVTQRRPGRIVLRDCPISPGGNDVRSYLDIVAPDGSGYAAIEQALGGFEAVVANTSPGSLAQQTCAGGMTLGFQAQFGVGDAQVQEYRELRDRALVVLQRFEAQAAA
jgi:hypothetical protein